MIAAGEKMLMDRDIEDLSIAELTSSLDYSAGSFYSGFTDKAAFFVAVQPAVGDAFMADVQRALSVDAVAELSLYERLARTIDLTLNHFRRRRGVIASALRHEARLPEAWAPHRASAQAVADAMVSGLAKGDADRLRVAVQMAFGTIVNALLHDPGPLRLNEPTFGTEMKAVLRPFLERG